MVDKYGGGGGGVMPGNITNIGHVDSMYLRGQGGGGLYGNLIKIDFIVVSNRGE